VGHTQQQQQQVGSRKMFFARRY